jgi:hypothetical protein
MAPMARISCEYPGAWEVRGNAIAIKITMANDPATTQRILFKTLGMAQPRPAYFISGLFAVAGSWP